MLAMVRAYIVWLFLGIDAKSMGWFASGGAWAAGPRHQTNGLLRFPKPPDMKLLKDALRLPGFHHVAPDDSPGQFLNSCLKNKIQDIELY
ncbi:hypothetical protein Sa4125_22960 [Aureimonas sp. SA4125]|nr:hypothetical protein Sa4125_22960 [Aureimonas sp. SA4125]